MLRLSSESPRRSLSLSMITTNDTRFSFATIHIDAAFQLDTRLFTYVRIFLSYLSVRSSSLCFLQAPLSAPFRHFLSLLV